MKIIKADWPAPNPIQAVSTTRNGGYSTPPFHHFNLADHVGDSEEAVAKNRALLSQQLKLNSEPCWLEQVHGNTAIQAQHALTQADASYTRKLNHVCVVLTADCLPILVCDKRGKEVAAIHGGWRSLSTGIIENTLAHFQASPNELMAWLGPAISQPVFQVGDEVRALFIAQSPDHQNAFKADSEGRFLANLYQIARNNLQQLGVKSIYGGDYCTYRDKEDFFSYRRDGDTGRMASLIWIKQ